MSKIRRSCSYLAFNRSAAFSHKAGISATAARMAAKKRKERKVRKQTIEKLYAAAKCLQNKNAVSEWLRARAPTRNRQTQEMICRDNGHTIERDDAYDAFYCVNCNFWLEPKCGDEMCVYCSKRPDSPR